VDSFRLWFPIGSARGEMEVCKEQLICANDIFDDDKNYKRFIKYYGTLCLGTQ